MMDFFTLWSPEVLARRKARNGPAPRLPAPPGREGANEPAGRHSADAPHIPVLIAEVIAALAPPGGW
jgi:hypothetical protein